MYLPPAEHRCPPRLTFEACRGAIQGGDARQDAIRARRERASNGRQVFLAAHCRDVLVPAQRAMCSSLGGLEIGEMLEQSVGCSIVKVAT